ncbi:hypothetical protein pmac_cds_553 [Pandoravirus macleodensis]|uniref:Uncharacterized protein n=1 Tax=Pandoravirus macleodensis TaxID=2107707 RepID=A0A2U7UGT3_9VIRU|nr:hypothetical protein pmac_cds_553 [Pandoravirus macleodensis]AVK77241.1 hypothetical protein pmac_cds_553 [Pandoravirus macleodensis]
MSLSHQYIASWACAYDKANGVKGMVVRTFELQQITSTDEHRAWAGRCWLRRKARSLYVAPLRVQQLLARHGPTLRVGPGEVAADNTSSGRVDALLRDEKGRSHPANDKTHAAPSSSTCLYWWPIGTILLAFADAVLVYLPAAGCIGQVLYCLLSYRLWTNAANASRPLAGQLPKTGLAATNSVSTGFEPAFTVF